MNRPRPPASGDASRSDDVRALVPIDDPDPRSGFLGMSVRKVWVSVVVIAVMGLAALTVSGRSTPSPSG